MSDSYGNNFGLGCNVGEDGIYYKHKSYVETCVIFLSYQAVID